MTDITLFMRLIQHHLCHDSSGNLPQHELDTDTVSNLLLLAKQHDIITIIGSVLAEQSHILSDAQQIFIQDYLCKAACYYEIMCQEILWLCDILEQAKIPHILLKGAVVRKYYPTAWMRTSGDIDILVPKDLVDHAVDILCQNGCNHQGKQRFHDIPLKTPGGNLLELHFNINEDIPSMDSVLGNVWEHSILVSGKCYEYRQSPEFLILHLLAHMSYHLVHGGCGIRSFIDIRLVMQYEKYDTLVLQKLLSEANLRDFYESVVNLNHVWFDEKPHNATTLTLEALVVDGGVFGSRNKEILIEQAQAGSKTKYILLRIFMRRFLLQKQYPILGKYPIFLPICQLLRWIRIVARNHTKALTEIHTSQSNSDTKIQKTKQAYEKIGIYF